MSKKNHINLETLIGRSAHHLNLERLIGISAHLILDGQMYLCYGYLSIIIGFGDPKMFRNMCKLRHKVCYGHFYSMKVQTSSISNLGFQINFFLFILGFQKHIALLRKASITRNHPGPLHSLVVSNIS